MSYTKKIVYLMLEAYDPRVSLERKLALIEKIGEMDGLGPSREEIIKEIDEQLPKKFPVSSSLFRKEVFTKEEQAEFRKELIFQFECIFNW